MSEPSTSNITVADLIKRKDELKNKAKKTAQLYIPSLGDNITVKAPDKALVMEALEMAEKDASFDADDYVLIECCVKPNLKDAELLADFGYDTPLQLVASGDIFTPGELKSIGEHLANLAGLNNKVTMVDHVKN